MSLNDVARIRQPRRSQSEKGVNPYFSRVN